MNKHSEIKLNLLKIYQDIKPIKDFSVKVDRLFADYRPLLVSFREDFNSAVKSDVDLTLKINRIYYDFVVSQEENYQEFAVTNSKSIETNIKIHKTKEKEISKKDYLMKSESKLVISNSEINAQQIINEAEKKVNKLIEATNLEIEDVKARYLKNSDALIEKRDQELLIIENDYQIKLDLLREKQKERHLIYENQIAQLRQIREQYVFSNSENYHRIKESHTNFSVYHNSRIDYISNLYWQKVKSLNEEYQVYIQELQDKILNHKNLMLQKEEQTNNAIENYSAELKNVYKNLKSNYDEDLRLIIANQNKTINTMSQELERKRKSIKINIAKKEKLLQPLTKSDALYKDYFDQLKTLKIELKSLLKNYNGNIKNLKDNNNILLKEIKESFDHKTSDLDIKFVEYEQEMLNDKNEFIVKSQRDIGLLNVEIEGLEEEKNQKIARFNNAYSKETTYLERILAIGSLNQELLIQDQVGENSLLLAENVYQNELVRTTLETDSEDNNLSIKELKINHQKNVQEITSRYQLLIQEEMVKRDNMIKQYKYEQLIAKANLKKNSLEAIFDYDLIKLRTEYELNHSLNENKRLREKLNYYLNLKKLKLENMTKKQEANLQLQIVKAKVKRTLEMITIEADKNNRFYLGLFDIIFNLHEKYDIIDSFVVSSYANPDFSMTKFYHLIDYFTHLTRLFNDDNQKIFHAFEQETNIYFDKKIEELTGFKFLNKKQELLDTFSRSEELVKGEIENIVAERVKIETQLNLLASSNHRDSIQISTLYRNIQAIKSNHITQKGEEQLIDLQNKLKSSKNNISVNKKNAVQLERQIKNKERQLEPLCKRLDKLSKGYENSKKQLSRQLRRDAKLYYRQKEMNLKLFKKLKELSQHYTDKLVNNFGDLKLNLDKTVEAINIYEKSYHLLRDKYINSLHELLNRFRQILLTIYHSEVNEQQNILSSFNNSYATLNKTLNGNYETLFMTEKRKNQNSNKIFDLVQNKLHRDFFTQNNSITGTYNSRNNQTINTIIEYDNLFKKTFTDMNDAINIIQTNFSQLQIDLENQTNNLVNEAHQQNTQYFLKKSTQLRQSLNKHERLYNDTIQRSLQYRQRYLDGKEENIEILHQWDKSNKVLIHQKQKEYRDLLKKLKSDQHLVMVNYRQSIKKKHFETKRLSQLKIRQIIQKKGRTN